MKFDERYKVYIDVTAQESWVWDEDTKANWQEVFPELDPFQWKLVDEELFHRVTWGEVTFRNDPYLDRDPYKIIANLDITQEVRIKITTPTAEYRGYFGANDCDYNEDEKVMTVQPAVLDKYTDIMENRESKIDVNGGRKVYRARWVLGTEEFPITATHKVPLRLVSSNLNEAQDQEQSGVPNDSGAIISDTKTKYGLIIEGSIGANISITATSSLTFYIREYSANNSLIQEIALGVFDEVGPGSLTFPISANMNIAQGSNLVIECGIATGANIDYRNVDVSASIAEQLLDASDLTIDLLATNLTTIEIWTPINHGRSSPKEREWEDTNGVSDYFDSETGEPLVDGRFADSDFGPDVSGPYKISNETDIINEDIDSLKLGDLVTALETYSYEVSAVTMFEGGTYRKWKPFGTKRRRVFSICSFSREEYWMAGTGEPPGEGWEATDYYDKSGKRLWVRPPFNGVITDWNLGAFDPTDGTIEGIGGYTSKQSSVKAYPPNQDSSRQLSSARSLRDIIKTIFNGTAASLNTKEVYSTFFWNDKEEDLTIYNSLTSGTNYVSYALPNPLNNIDCVHTKDFDLSDTDMDESDVVLELSFKDIMNDLKKLWPVYWFIDDNGDLRIEHIKYLDLTKVSYDVRAQKAVDETLKFDFDKSEMFATISYTMINAAYPDFVDNYRAFDKIASNKRNDDFKLDLSTEYLSTDVKYCIEAADSLDSNGLCLINHDDNNVMVNAPSPISGQVIENGTLALSNLLKTYWRYEGVWLIGEINEVYTEFIKSSRTKVGKAISLKGTYDKNSTGEDILFITTGLGEGLIKSMKVDMDRAISEDVVLLYRFDQSTQGDNLKSASISDEFELVVSEDVLYDFGNY